MKKIIIYTFLVVSYGLSLSTLIAQPENYGCHYHNNLVPVHPLSAEEKQQLALDNSRSDTIDILNYGITLQVINYADKLIHGFCEVTFTPKVDGVDHILLDLLEFEIDSITIGQQSLSYSYDGLQIDIDFPQAYNMDDTAALTVFYHGTPIIDPTGFGGFDFSGSYAYNLGIGLGSNPYNYGRGWYPCFDTFKERATFDFNIITANGRRAFCVGHFINQQTLQGDTIVRRYRMDNPIATYQAGVAVSNYVPVNGMHQGAFGPIPTQLLAKPTDTTAMKSTFSDLADAIDALEFWYGPYVWNRVGYVITTRGAMEHASNIAYPEFVGLGGNDFGQNRLMAHELCHHWWGNITNGSTAADMWLKEGNAEYGAHLFTEWHEGHEAFIKQVKDNHNRVLREAHVDDDLYLPLSGIPYEYTYGTHTYYKGASMLHNMRGYLGDSLFRIGQQAVLNDYRFSPANAQQYRDALTNATGVDMASFFDDWIYSSGWAAYEIDSVKVIPDGNQFDVRVFVEQKLRHAPHFHTNAPIEITFIRPDWSKEVRRVMVSGQQSEVQLQLDFQPKTQFINEAHRLNLAQWTNNKVVTTTGNVGLDRTEFQINVLNLPDSALLFATHYWVAADPFADNSFGARVSPNHYWRVGGVLPDGFKARANVNWNKFHDESLVSVTEDSLILVYRPDPSFDWREYPHYAKINLIPTDMAGFFRIDSLLPGDYAFANGDIPLVSSKEPKQLLDVQLFPNPAQEQLHISAQLDQAAHWQLSLYDIHGKQIDQYAGGFGKERIEATIDVHHIPQGIYFIEISDIEGNLLGSSHKLEIIR